ncbi:MAG: glycosyltransferase N-terminal domain-containing protein [Pseudomonadota bacterium]
MTTPADMHRGWALRAYLGATYALTPFAGPVLRRRLAKGKEHTDRWREKLGHGLAPRPQGRLVWLHGVGLGEVMSLRGLITRMAARDPDLQFLVTSTTRVSAEVFARNLPRRTLHQFLPLDLPGPRRRFLDHFRPDLCIWAEQDLWPGFVSDLAQRGIPQAVVAARMNARSFRSHNRGSSLFRDLYGAMRQVTAQDKATAEHLKALGARATVTGSLKPAAPELSFDAAALEKLSSNTKDRLVWAVAPAHPQDAAIAKAAHAELRKVDPTSLLIIAPRFPETWEDATLPHLSAGQMPKADDPIWLCDTFGDLGLVYRLSQAVLIGGTFSDVEGHNPWEAAQLGNAIFHGPRTANFAADFTQLIGAGASVLVEDATDLAKALQANNFTALTNNAKTCVMTASKATDALVDQLCALLDPADAN